MEEESTSNRLRTGNTYDPHYATFRIDLPDTTPAAIRKINSRTYTSFATGLEYQILTYDKAFICIDESDIVTQCRSVILEKNGRLLSFSPPRSIPLHTFMQKYSLEPETFHCTETIEGTLIHLFYDPRIESWEIATKNAVGGNYKLFRKTLCKNQPDVREMFLDAIGAEPKTPLNEIPTIARLEQHYSYSLVLQHPANPIVLPVDRPSLYVVAIYDISPMFGRAVAIPPSVFQSWNCFLNGTLLFPADYSATIETYADIVGRVASLQMSYQSMGAMIVNVNTGERCAVPNSIYDEVLRIREMDACLQYQYLCLARIGRTEDYLRIFPKHRRLFGQFGEQYREYVENVHASYMTKYVNKNNRLPILPILPKYAYWIERLHHEIRIPSLSTKTPVSITRKIVRDFMQHIEPDEMFYWLNYERRQYSAACSNSRK